MQEREQMFAHERQERILSLLKRDKKVFVRDLCELLSVSAVTVRNDLRELEERRALLRTHGGAIPYSNTGFEENTEHKNAKKVAEKKAIAREAAKYVSDGDTIAIDTGTTAYEFAKALTDKKNLTVVTNDMRVALYLDENSEAGVILLGGFLRRGYNCSIGPITEETLSHLFMDKCFMATNGLTASAGATTPNAEQATIKRMMIEHSNQIILLCDGDKVGRNSLVSFAPVEKLHRIITDEGARGNEMSAIESLGAEVDYVSLDKN